MILRLLANRNLIKKLTDSVRARKILFLFLDGIGLGEDNPEINPFARAVMPYLQSLLGGKRLIKSTAPFESERVSFATRIWRTSPAIVSRSSGATSPRSRWSAVSTAGNISSAFKN